MSNDRYCALASVPLHDVLQEGVWWKLAATNDPSYVVRQVGEYVDLYGTKKGSACNMAQRIQHFLACFKRSEDVVVTVMWSVQPKHRRDLDTYSISNVGGGVMLVTANKIVETTTWQEEANMHERLEEGKSDVPSAPQNNESPPHHDPT